MFKFLKFLFTEPEKKYYVLDINLHPNQICCSGKDVEDGLYELTGRKCRDFIRCDGMFVEVKPTKKGLKYIQSMHKKNRNKER